jgi:hypothetical protein
MWLQSSLGLEEQPNLPWQLNHLLMWQKDGQRFIGGMHRCRKLLGHAAVEFGMSLASFPRSVEPCYWYSIVAAGSFPPRKEGSNEETQERKIQTREKRARGVWGFHPREGGSYEEKIHTDTTDSAVSTDVGQISSAS